MQTMSIVPNTLGSKDAGLFNQIAMFSATGLAISMALVVVWGLEMMNPWF